MKFDLRKIIEVSGIPEKKLAKELFPTNNYPMHALNRVLLGTSKLDTDQLIRLSALTGIRIGDLFGDTTVTYSNGTHKIETDTYVADLDFPNCRIRLLIKNRFRTEMVLYSQAIALDQLLSDIEHIINN